MTLLNLATKQDGEEREGWEKGTADSTSFYHLKTRRKSHYNYKLFVERYVKQRFKWEELHCVDGLVWPSPPACVNKKNLMVFLHREITEPSSSEGSMAF